MDNAIDSTVADPTATSGPVDQLRAAHNTLTELRTSRATRIEAAVKHARAAGAKWREIAEALGRHESHVIRQYGPIDAGKRKETALDSVTEEFAAIRAGEVDHAAAVKAARRAELQAVADARNARVTWQEIGDVLGMLQPNVVQKFKRLLVQEHDIRVTVRPDAIPDDNEHG